MYIFKKTWLKDWNELTFCQCCNIYCDGMPKVVLHIGGASTIFWGMKLISSLILVKLLFIWVATALCLMSAHTQEFSIISLCLPPQTMTTYHCPTIHHSQSCLNALKSTSKKWWKSVCSSYFINIHGLVLPVQISDYCSTLTGFLWRLQHWMDHGWMANGRLPHSTPVSSIIHW